MKENELEQRLKQRADKEIVIAEIPITNTQLHAIAEGKCCSISKPGELFGVRFLSRGSFKTSKGNFMIHQFNMQIIALGKENAMRKEEIKSLTKFAPRKKEVKANEKPINFNMAKDKKELF